MAAHRSVSILVARLVPVVCLLFSMAMVSSADEIPVASPGGKPVDILTVSGDKIFDRMKSSEAENIGFWLVDLRTEAEFNKKFIPGAINIPYKKLSFMAEKIFMQSDNIVFYGNPGFIHDSVNACTFMKQKGFDNCNVLENGIDGWPGHYEQGKLG